MTPALYDTMPDSRDVRELPGRSQLLQDLLNRRCVVMRRNGMRRAGAPSLGEVKHGLAGADALDPGSKRRTRRAIAGEHRDAQRR